MSNQVGALAKVLNIFAEAELNMSKIQSMPVLGKRNEYNFYVDVEWKKRAVYARLLFDRCRVVAFAHDETSNGDFADRLLKCCRTEWKLKL